MLDVITIVSDTTPRQFVTECRASIQRAIAQCPYPVNAIETPGVPGHIGQAMAAGIAASSAEYIAFVDDDDFVLPNAFACLERHFDRKPTAICAREIAWLANGRIVPSDRRHHLTAFRRDIVEAAALEANPATPNVDLHAAAAAQVVDELSWVYVHRIYRSAGMKLRGARRGVRS